MAFGPSVRKYEGMVIEGKNEDETAKGCERLRICALLLKLKGLISEFYNGFQVYKCFFSVSQSIR